MIKKILSSFGWTKNKKKNSRIPWLGLAMVDFNSLSKYPLRRESK